jgi:DNA-binding beta-propeller fold protein YncE
VYDGNGVLLVPLSAHKTVTAMLFDQEYTFDVDKDGSAVVLTRCATTSDKDVRGEAFAQNRAYKIRMREEDSKTVQQEITAKQLEIEDSYSEERDTSDPKGHVQELEWLFLQRGKHKKELLALQQQSDQKIKVTNTTCFEATELPLGQVIVLAPHGKVCMFLHRPPESAVSWGWKDTAVESMVYSAWETQKASLCSKNLPYTTFLADKKGLHSIVTTAQFVFLSFPDESYVAQYLLSGELVQLIGNTGSVDTGKLDEPLGMAVKEGQLFVADYAKDHVCVYLISGDVCFLEHIGSTATTPRPTDVAFDGEIVFVAIGRAGVYSYVYNDRSRRYVEGPGTNSPHQRGGVGVEAEAEAVAIYGNAVYVTYRGENIIGVFDRTKGTPLNKIDFRIVDSSQPVDEGDCFPGILVGARYVFVVRCTRGVVYVYNRLSRAFVTVLTAGKISGSNTTVRRNFFGLAFDTQGRLLVTDAHASCVHKFDVDLILERYKTMENS